MSKKILMVITGILAGAFIFAAKPVDVEAALSCTYDIIYDANGNITNADQMYALAQANATAALNNYNSLKKAGTCSALELQQAADAVTNANNVARWWLDQLNNAKTYLGNIKDREKFEDQFAANRAALADLTKLQAAKLEADGALNIANAVIPRINDTEKAIAGYKQQLATSPSFQTQIDSLTDTLALQRKDYADKMAIYEKKAEIYLNYAKTLNYASYSKDFEDYQYNREINRNNLAWLAQYNNRKK